MDDSVIIVDEVKVEKTTMSESKMSKKRQQAQQAPPREQPKRQRKPVQQYHLLQQEEREQTELLRQQRKQLREQRLSIGRQAVDVKPALASPPLVQLTLQQLPNSTLTQKNNPVKKKPLAPPKPPKPPRNEAGGAGTMKVCKKNDSDVTIVFQWDAANVIAARQQVPEEQVRNVIQMFDQEATLPFIARYRREKTGDLDVEKLREIQNSYSQLKTVQERVLKVMKSDDPKLTIERKKSLLFATTIHEVEHLTAALKGSSKRTYAERARELGIEPVALEILQGVSQKYVNRRELCCLVKPEKEGLRTLDEVEEGLQHILADIFNKDTQVLQCVRELMKTCRPYLECFKAKKQVKKDGAKLDPKTASSSDLCLKYQDYFQFKNFAWDVKPHAMMAMNRGEKQGVLSVRISIPDEAYGEFCNFCRRKWLSFSMPEHYRTQLIMLSLEDGWERLVKPFMQRQIRSELTERAEIASVEVFAKNLRQLLLTPPVRGKTILAIDPGFKNGCKIAVTNSAGEMLLVTTIYPFKDHQSPSGNWNVDHNALTLREIVFKYKCDHFVLGNGTACRETEKYLTTLIGHKCFDPFDVKYTIVNETGASQYSITPEARAEFPQMDVNHISAVSLARRLQDPLLEYIKVHPMHLGVGMYQHDIPERLLHSSLDSVMTECVSFVGVDINVASEFVLRKLSGLTKARAAHIVEHRKTKGPFVNREQLKEVKGIGPKTFEQCAGFVRILPESLEAEKSKTPKSRQQTEEMVNYFDRTSIHPESYHIASKLVYFMKLLCQDIGSLEFTAALREFMQNSSIQAASEHSRASQPMTKSIIEALAQPLDYDLRAQFSKPLFRCGITSMGDLKLGTVLTGAVTNVTAFGAFVDVGVGENGLIHSSRLRSHIVQLGNIVEVRVESIDLARGRLGLILLRLLG